MKAKLQQKKIPNTPLSKESIYELQKMDCNCNDCSYLFRQIEKQNALLEANKINDKETFEVVRDHKLEDIRDSINSLNKHKLIIKDFDEKVSKLENKAKIIKEENYVYQGAKSPIQYGICCKFKKEITFIANTFQTETQECFIHRKENQN